MRLLLDTSALAKRYLLESGTDLVLERCKEADEVVLSVICIPELFSAFNRLKRERKLTPLKYRQLKHEFSADIADAIVIDLHEGVLKVVVQTLETASVRAMDAIHIATAIDTQCDRFLSADPRQYRAARRMGLNVEEVT